MLEVEGEFGDALVVVVGNDDVEVVGGEAFADEFGPELGGGLVETHC